MKWRVIKLLKDDGRSRQSKKNKEKGYERIKCPYCKKEINLEKAKEDGYLDKYLNVTTCECPYCNESFSI